VLILPREMELPLKAWGRERIQDYPQIVTQFPEIIKINLKVKYSWFDSINFFN